MSSDDDPTKKVPDEAKYDTKPGITAVLERINQLGEKLSSEIATIRSEMQTGFKRLEQKIELLHKDLFELRTDHELLEKRVEQLEEKAS